MKKLLALLMVLMFVVCSSGVAMAVEYEGPEDEVETTSEEEESDDGETGEVEASGGEYRCLDKDPKTFVERLKYRFMCDDSQQ